LDTARLPERIFETPSPVGGLNRDYLTRALSYAQKIIVRELETSR